MPLPESNSGAWPPPSEAKRQRRIRIYDAWYAGGERLASVYGGTASAGATTTVATTINPTGAARVASSIRGAVNRLWGQAPAQGEPDTRRHLPTAQDIAIASSEYLHADTPTFTVVGPTYPSDAPATFEADGVTPAEPAHRKGDPMPVTVKAQERLDEILDGCNIGALLLQSSEVGAALGSVALRIAFDKAAGMRMPRLVRVDADATVPHFTWGAQSGVTFWRYVTVPGNDRKTFRHLELHEGGRIFHALYEGEPDELGTRIPMTEGDQTCRAIALNLDADSALIGEAFVFEGVPVKTAASIPNVLPDPLDRANLAGRSDYTEAVIDLLDAGDRVYTQFLQNIDDAVGRILIGRSMLESAGIGRGLTFDASQRIFTKLNVPPAEKEGGALPIDKVQFDLRSEEYLATIEAFVVKAIEAAGYSVRSGHDADGGDRTATEVNSEDSKSDRTRDKKIAYWRTELEDLATALLVIDAREFGSGVTPFRVEVTYPPGSQEPIASLATTAKTLRDAKLASIQVGLALVHPDWDERQVRIEMERLEEEAGARRILDPAIIGLSGRLPGDAVPPPAEPTAPAGTPPAAPSA